MQSEINLIRSGMISSDDFVDAISLQEEMRPRLGQVALEEGILTPRQVREALQRQEARPELLFGEAAIELGHLSRANLAQLLVIQQQRQRPLIEVLVELGRLTQGQATTAQRLCPDPAQKSRKSRELARGNRAPTGRSDQADRLAPLIAGANA